MHVRLFFGATTIESIENMSSDQSVLRAVLIQSSIKLGISNEIESK